MMDMCELCRIVCFRVFIRSLRKRLFICLLLISCLCCFPLYDFLRYRKTSHIVNIQMKLLNTTSFPLLITALQNQSCVHPSLDPHHPSVIKFFHPVPKLKCETGPDWILTRNGSAHILPEAEERHGQISCHVIPLLRGRTDDVITYGTQSEIKGGKAKVNNDFFKASCKSESGQRYMNVHSTIAFNSSIFERLDHMRSQNSFNKLSIIMLGFDSVSRNTWLRMLPLSYSYFKNNLRGTVLEGYNIVGDGTPQALLPILTGKTEEDLPEARKGHHGATHVDNHPWIWKNFSNNGYATQWGEDMAYIGTFNMRMTGFKEQPVDHYMRPFYLLTERLHPYFKPFCLGSQPRHRIMFNYLKDFVDMYKEYPKFSFLFHSEYSHDEVNNLQWVDTDLTSLLKYLFQNNHLNSSVLVLMSDHGARFHNIRQTLQGKYEERMPFFAFRFPPWFLKTFPLEYMNLLQNSKRLVTPFDIHATFEHILDIAGTQNTTDIRNNSRGISILRKISKNRSCYDAGVAPHWCACLPWKYNDVNTQQVIDAVEKVITFINSVTKDFRQLCSSLSLFRVIRSMTFTPNSDVLQYAGSEDKDGRHAKFDDSFSIPPNMLQITFQATPGEAVFEATVIHDQRSNNFVVNDQEISRTNAYGSSADCIANIAPNIRQYCFCI